MRVTGGDAVFKFLSCSGSRDRNLNTASPPVTRIVAAGAETIKRTIMIRMT